MIQSVPPTPPPYRRRRAAPAVAFRAFVAAAAFAIGNPGIVAQAHPQNKPAKPSRVKTKPKPTTPPGGANQVKGAVTGGVGDMLFDGKWRFQVVSVGEPTNTYTLSVISSEQDYGMYRDVASMDVATHTFSGQTGYTLIPIKCLAKNGQNKVQQLDFYLNSPKTALTDDKGNSYPPIAYDMQSKGAWMTKPLLPGSQVEITILFAVPPGTKPKDLVVTIKNWTDSKGTDVRVSLDKSAPAR